MEGLEQWKVLAEQWKKQAEKWSSQALEHIQAEKWSSQALEYIHQVPPEQIYAAIAILIFTSFLLILGMNSLLFYLFIWLNIIFYL